LTCYTKIEGEKMNHFPNTIPKKHSPSTFSKFIKERLLLIKKQVEET